MNNNQIITRTELIGSPGFWVKLSRKAIRQQIRARAFQVVTDARGVAAGGARLAMARS